MLCMLQKCQRVIVDIFLMKKIHFLKGARIWKRHFFGDLINWYWNKYIMMAIWEFPYRAVYFLLLCWNRWIRWRSILMVSWDICWTSLGNDGKYSKTLSEKRIARSILRSIKILNKMKTTTLQILQNYFQKTHKCNLTLRYACFV